MYIRILIFSLLSLFACQDVESQFLYEAAKTRSSVVQTPQDILGSNLKLWIDGRTGTNKTLIGNVANARGVTAFSSDDSNNIAFTSIGVNRLIYQGKALYVRNDAVYKHASKSYFNFLHDGIGDWYYAERFMVIDPSSTDQFTLVSNNNGTTLRTGISITYDNRSASSRTNAIVVTITKSTGGTSVLQGVFNNAFTPNVFHTIELEFVTSTGVLTLYVDGSSVGTANRSSTHVTTDATDDFHYNIMSGAASAAFKLGLRKHCVIANRVLTGGEKTSIRNFMNYGSEDFGTVADLDVYAGEGQSNFRGELNTPIPTGLSGPLNSRTCYNAAAPSSSVVQIPYLMEANLTSNMGSGTNIGPFVRVSEQLSQVTNVLTIPFGVGGTSLYRQTGVDDWNVASNEYANTFKSMLVQIIKYDLKYAFDCTGTLRGIATMQGESDAGREMAITGLTSASPGVITMATTTNVDVGTRIKFLTLNGDQQIGGVAINGQYATVVSKTGTTLTLDVNVTGASPATSGSIGLCSWKLDKTAFIKYILDELTTAGVSTTKVRWIIGRIHNNYSPARSMAVDVRSDQDDMVNFLTDNPSYSSKITAVHVTDSDSYDMYTDTVHFTTTGNSQQGYDWADIWDDYINE